MSGLTWKPGDQMRPMPMDTVTYECYHCHRETRFPTRSVNDAKECYYESINERFVGVFNDIIKKCHLLHGTDPMTEWFLKSMLKLREEMGDWEEGEEWKKPQ